jgi:hypothetical protein
MSRRDAGGIRPDRLMRFPEPKPRKPLPVDRDKQLAWQRRGAEKYAAKQRARKAAARLTSRIDDKRRRTTKWPPAIRRLASRRSGGVCEIDGEHPADHLHHRKGRRHGDHRICNALHVCWFHHEMIHGRAGGGTIARSYELGWIVPSHLDPADIPAVLHDEPRLLTLDGDYREAA